MKKLLEKGTYITLLLLVTIASYGQTYQNPTFGTITSKTAPTVTNTPYLAAIDANGVIDKILPDNIVAESRVAVNDVSYIISGGGNKIIAYTAITADRTVTLPLANTANQRIWITDESGLCSNARRIIVQPNGSDVIGGDSFSVINFPNGSGYLESNGAGKWNIISTTSVQFSAGVNTLPTITDNGNGSVTIGNNGVYSLYANDTGIGRPKAYQIAGGTFTCTDGTFTYIVAKYNTSTGAVSVTTESNFANVSGTTEIAVFSIFRQGTTLYIMNHDTKGIALATKLDNRLLGTNKFTIETGGLLLGEAGTRNITTTAGTVWFASTKIDLLSKNSATNTTRFVFKSGGVWNTTTTATQYNNTQYQNGANLATLSNNNYAVNWIYEGLTNQGELAYVLGTGDYNLGQAQTSQPPSDLPLFITGKMVLVGRIIIQKNAVSASAAGQIDQAQNTFLTPGGTNDHNALNNVQQAGTGVTNGHINDQAQTIAGSKTFTSSITAKNGLTTPSSYIALFGDSTIAAYSGQNGVDFYLLTSEDSRTGCTIINKAIPGDNINGQLGVWNSDANKATYDVIIIQVGLNDVGFTETNATVIGRLQNFVNQINSTKKSTARIIIGTLTPTKQHWIDAYGVSNGAIAQAQWEAINTAIRGGGSTPITGVSATASEHTSYLSDGDNNLALKYELTSPDHIHENNLGRAIIANSWRGILSNLGIVNSNKDLNDKYFINSLKDVILKDGNLITSGDLPSNRLNEFINRTQNSSSRFEFRTDGNASYANNGPCGGVKMGWAFSSNPMNYISIDIIRGLGATDGAAIGFSTTNSSSVMSQGMMLTRSNGLIIQNGGTFTDAGYRLDVTGTTRLNGAVTYGVVPTTSAGAFYFLTGNNSTNVTEKILSNTIATISSPAFTGTPTAPTATAGTNTTQIATTAFVQAIKPYTNYVAKIQQTSTSDPTASVRENTLSGAIVWTRSGVGTYVGTLSGAFPSDSKTVFYFSKNTPPNYDVQIGWTSTNTVEITTRNASGTLVDGAMGSLNSLEIRVYP